MSPLPSSGGVVSVAKTPIAQTRDGKSKEDSFFGNLTAYVGERVQISGGVRRITANAPRTQLVIGANSLLFDAGGAISLPPAPSSSPGKAID